MSTLLPKGSSPGLWGVESIDLIDRANNTKHYSFVELVRFDIEEKDSSQKVNPIVEILGKKVNAKNVDSVSLSISCKTCAQKNYRARIYSDMGGESVLYEGVMDKDSIVVKNLKLSGVNDGVLYATVFILDTSKVLLGIGKAQYTKDVVAPKSSILKTNLSNFGKSNIDSLIYEMKVSELNCNYNLVLTQASIVKTSSIGSSEDIIKTMSLQNNDIKVGDSLVLSGKLTDSVFKLKNVNLSIFEDGIIELKMVLKDSLGNETTPVKTNIYKDTKDPIVTIKKSTANNSKIVYTIAANEFLSNNLIKDSLSINVGKIDSLIKISNKQYEAYITRVCTEKLVLTIKSNALLDTVGNKNIATNYYAEATEVPVITRDTSNALLSSSTYGNIWYKDGVAINDTTQKYKPTTAGSYSLKKALDGCISNMSNAYYYLVTDVINLIADEFIKLAPNQFINQLNFDFIVRGYQRLNLEVFDVATGMKKASMQNLTPGVPLYLGQLSTGTYYVRVSSKDGKINYQFKMIKL